MSMYNDIPVGLRVPASLPLDAKLWVKSKVQLQSLGPSNNLAYTYYKGMRIYCADEKEIYEWMPDTEGRSKGLTPLLSSAFTYPLGYNVNDINYSGIAYNLFKIPQAWDIVIPEVPGLQNVGDGADVYKGLSGGNHQIRGIKANVTKPVTPGQIIGSDNITFNAIVNGDNIEINLDLSTLSVPIQQLGIPEYYVHSAGNDSTADGSIVRPYKTWEACKKAIIDPDNGGTFYNPQKNGVKVIFQTHISSDEDLTVRNVNYRFENNSVFTYTGTEEAVFDMDKLKANTNQSQHTFEGSGIIRGIDKSIILRAGALSPTVRGESYFSVTIKAGASITIEESLSANYINTNFEVSDNGIGNPCTDGGSNPVYVLKKDDRGTDVVPPNEGILSIKGHNFPVWQCFNIESGGILKVRPSINRAVYVYDSNLINYGSLIFDASLHTHPTDGTISCVRHGGIDPNIKAVLPGDSVVGRYKPSETVSLMHIDTPVISPTSSSAISTSSSGFISGFLLGSTNQGGFNAVIELAGKSSTFQVTSNSPMTWNNRMRYNFLVYVADLDIQPNPDNPSLIKRVMINNIYSQASFQKALIGGVSGITSGKFIMSIGQGVVGAITKDKIITSSVTTSITDVLRASSFLQLAGEIYNTTLLNRNYPDNDTAINNGLLRGMLYITKDKDSSILKIVH